MSSPAVPVPSKPALPDSGWQLCVAPMMDWTDRHCRMFHRVLAPRARLYTEMVHANAVVLGDRERLLGFDSREHPLALQLGGSESELLAKAARIGAARGYDEINLNVGCPSDRVQSGRFGACLMREPALVADCVAAMRAAVQVPVTVKCRIGVDEQDPEHALFDLVDQTAAAGCRVFIVHARKAWLQGLSPRENREVPPLDYALVQRLKRARTGLKIVLNGGLDAVDDALQLGAGLDGVMLGRVAYHQPYRLHELACRLDGTPTRSRESLLRDFFPYVEQALSSGAALKHISRHILGLFHGEPGGRAFRQVLSEGAHRPGAGMALLESALAATASRAHAA